LPAKNDNAVVLINRVIVLRGQASLLQHQGQGGYYGDAPRPRSFANHDRT